MKELIVAIAFAVIVSNLVGQGHGASLEHRVSDQGKVWITLANVTNSDTLCLSLPTPTGPFGTCLVGVPIPMDGWAPLYNQRVQNNCSKPGVRQPKRCKLHLALRATVPAVLTEPLELDLLGTLQAMTCFYFNYSTECHMNQPGFDISPKGIYANVSLWCSETLHSQFAPSVEPIGLPEDLFLICGRRAWRNIPRKATGGPCTFGQLTLFHPAKLPLNRTLYGRTKRSTHDFSANCDSDVHLGNGTERVFAGIKPSMGTAKSLTDLDQLGCWLETEVNATSLALSALLTDAGSVRHATLQKRAAKEVLLLAQDHGCQDFEGTCCMNLSDYSETVDASLQKMKDLVKQLHRDDSNTLWGWFNWLDDSGLGPVWVWGVAVLGVFIFILVCTRCYRVFSA